MKTILVISLVTIFAVIFSDGCQEGITENKGIEREQRSLYLKRDNTLGSYCRFKVYEDFNRKKVIDTICIRCSGIADSIGQYIPCIDEKEYRFIWDQEYYPLEDKLTWRPLYLEKIHGFFMECTYCFGRRTFRQTYYGDTDGSL
jgi:hypothetical protein